MRGKDVGVVIVKAGKLICSVCELPCTHPKLVQEGIAQNNEWAMDIAERVASCTTVCYHIIAPNSSIPSHPIFNIIR